MKRERFEKMNVVPFIDIVLVLLVIILATSTFIHQSSIKVDLPTSSSKKSEDVKNIKFSVTQDGSYFLKKQKLTIAQVKHKISLLNPQKDVVSLNIDKDSKFKYFVTIIDLLKKNSFENINIVTKE